MERAFEMAVLTATIILRVAQGEVNIDNGDGFERHNGQYKSSTVVQSGVILMDQSQLCL